MTTTPQAVIEQARKIAMEVTGAAEPEVVMEVLARMVITAAAGLSSGFLRLPPIRPAEINPRQPRSLEE